MDSKTSLDTTNLLSSVREWASRAQSALRASARSSVRQDKHLSRSVKVVIREDKGMPVRISIQFYGVGVYIHVGAGRGYGGSGRYSFYSTSRISRDVANIGREGKRELKGMKKQVAAASIGKMGTGRRPARPWVDSVLTTMLPELSEIISRELPDSFLKGRSISTDLFL